MNGMFDTTAKGLDNLVFTQQERSVADMKIFEARLEFIKSVSNTNTVSSRARRVLAFMFVGVFLSLLLLAVAYRIAGSKDVAEFIFEAAASIKVHVGGVMTFYFGQYMLKRYFDKKKEVKND